MNKKSIIILSFILFGLFATAFNTYRKTYTPAAEGFRIDTIADNLRVPWQIVFLPDKSILFTEREGRVRIIRKHKLLPKSLLNLDDIVLRNKSGALGICLHPDFEKNQQVYLASNYLLDGRMKLRIVRYHLIGDTLINAKVILQNLPANQNHTGCRLIFGPDKKLYITTGDADQPMLAQDLKAYNGKILRLNSDGSIPSDNPFVKNDTALKEIWSYGHRNPQGIAFEPGTGQMFASEHGPTGGDEINLIKKGANYGWPLIHHDDRHEGMEPPLQQYSPSIGPAEIMFYKGNRLPQLKGRLLMACLRGESIMNISLKNNQITDQMVMFKNRYGRIRSLVEGPDGLIYFSTSMHDPGEGHPRDKHDDMILCISPSATTGMADQQVFATKVPLNSSKKTAKEIFGSLCASCHGDKLQGTATAKGFLKGSFLYGSDQKSIIKSIKFGIIEKGMPAWNGAINDADISEIADFILASSGKGTAH
ncbi:PQQ-dependent sugar dehydrogenase [Pedobacter sp. GSP4]|uniref:PQQ-dependent sugar dehydrogenase n=1 Tax=Pedobacter sp. GSP4 TaxID=3453716 RepID=UPI003EE861E0